MTDKIAVFFDRDGTLNVEAGYIREVNNLVLAEGAAVAVKKLNDLDILCILVTNQTGAARGYYPESHIHALHERLVNLLAEQQAHLDEIYYCPHYEQGIVQQYSFACQCRKPEPGMIKAAMVDYPEIDLKNSYVVGDKATDVDLAVNAGCKSVLLTTGYGKQVLEGTYQELKNKPDFIANSITEAVDWIIKDIRDQK
jgi:D-glycero-D-manno-heptose 1,7-bisphosphate phosphatase